MRYEMVAELKEHSMGGNGDVMKHILPSIDHGG